MNAMRSWLFVPGDSARKLARALDCGADVLILDLEDSVALSAKQAARETVAHFLRDAARAGPRLYVRVNALDSRLADADIEAVLPAAPHGIVLPKSQGAGDVLLLDGKLGAREPVCGIADGATRIAAIVTETAGALFAAGSYGGAGTRLEALAWGGEDLSADLGASVNRDPDGRWTDPYRLARTLCLAGAVAAGLQPLDTVWTAFRDLDGLAREAETAKRDGFTGKLAIHPAQVPVINATFTPSPREIERAEAIVAIFADTDAGVADLNGEMIDRPHMRRAERLLARARAAGAL